MRIVKLTLKEGLECSNDTFSEKRNLIFSENNTKGKTTYIRLLLYSLGYQIPSIKGINFDKIETSIVITEKSKEYRIERAGNSLQLFIDKDILSYTLPSEHESFLSHIFEYDNIKVIRNLLGFLYIDQDKGWSLLNRGTVVGKIKFNIEELLSGLNKIDITSLIEKKKELQYNKNKYAALLNVKELSEQVYEHHGEIFVSDVEKEYSEKIAFINLEIGNLNESLKEINSLIRKESQFFNYIDSMKLFVKSPSGDIPVKRDTLVNAPETTEFLKARRSIIITDIEKLKRQKAAIESHLSDYALKNAQMSFISTEDESNIIEKKLATFSNIDQEMVLSLLNKATEDLRKVNNEIKYAVKNNNKFISKIYEYVFDYATKLGVEEKMVQKEDYIFTSDLKSMSGAVLQKMVFAFKLAFLKVIEEDMNTKLFMIIDSPKSKELDDANTNLIMDLIKSELDSNQVFIASIYDFECEKRITIKSRAIEDR